jgi:hypothetical protein
MLVVASPASRASLSVLDSNVCATSMQRHSLSCDTGVLFERSQTDRKIKSSTVDIDSVSVYSACRCVQQ